MPSEAEAATVLQEIQLLPLFTELPAPSSCQKRLELSLRLQLQHRHTPERAPWLAVQQSVLAGCGHLKPVTAAIQQAVVINLIKTV